MRAPHEIACERFDVFGHQRSEARRVSQVATPRSLPLEARKAGLDAVLVDPLVTDAMLLQRLPAGMKARVLLRWQGCDDD